MMIHTMNSPAVHCSLLSSVDAAAAGGGGAAGPDDGLAAVTGDSYICTPALYPQLDCPQSLFYFVPHSQAGLAAPSEGFRTFLGFCCFTFDMLEGSDWFQSKEGLACLSHLFRRMISGGGAVVT